jgi:hypothetical protein
VIAGLCVLVCHMAGQTTVYASRCLCYLHSMETQHIAWWLCAIRGPILTLREYSVGESMDSTSYLHTEDVLHSVWLLHSRLLLL